MFQIIRSVCYAEMFKYACSHGNIIAKIFFYLGEMFKQVRKAALLNGNRVNSYDVTVVQGTPNAYDVTFKPQNCSQNIPFLGLAPLEQVSLVKIRQNS